MTYHAGTSFWYVSVLTFPSLELGGLETALPPRRDGSRQDIQATLSCASAAHAAAAETADAPTVASPTNDGARIPVVRYGSEADMRTGTRVVS